MLEVKVVALSKPYGQVCCMLPPLSNQVKHGATETSYAT